MNPRPEASLMLSDVMGLFAKYRRLVITGILVCVTLFTVAAFTLPSKYKAHFVLTIYPKYFQSILIGDFIPEMNGDSEMRSQRESLIRQVFTPSYLDSMGTRHGIYTSFMKPVGPPSRVQALRTRLKNWCVGIGLYHPASKENELSAEREELRDRIKIFDLSNTTFNIGFIYSDPAITYEVAREMHAQVIQSLLDVRMNTLVNIRDAIQKRLDSLSSSIASAPPIPLTTTTPQPAGDELTEVRRQISNLTSQYTEEHPLVVQLRDRERMLLNRMINSSGVQRAGGHRSSLEGGTREANREIYDDLTKKLNYLTIALDSDRQHQADYFATLETPLYPARPLWPKKGLFVIWGFALGLFGSLFIAALLEYFERSTLHTHALAQQVGVPLLGELPPFPWKAPRTLPRGTPPSPSAHPK